MRNAPLLGYPSSRITSAALCSYRSYNSAARLRCSLEYLAMMTTPPAQGVQHSVTTSNGTPELDETQTIRMVLPAQSTPIVRPALCPTPPATPSSGTWAAYSLQNRSQPI